VKLKYLYLHTNQNQEGRREKGEGRREKGEGRREREKGEGRREKGEGRKEEEGRERKGEILLLQHQHHESRAFLTGN
jgi:hypothetical protein